MENVRLNLCLAQAARSRCNPRGYRLRLKPVRKLIGTLPRLRPQDFRLSALRIVAKMLRVNSGAKRYLREVLRPCRVCLIRRVQMG